MSEKLWWLFAFVSIYWAYCLFWGFRGARSAKSASDYFIAGRSLGTWVFVLAATATSFSGWTFIGHPGKILTDGLPYAFASFYALTIPFTGVLFLRRQWVLGRAFQYVTPGEMYTSYFGGNSIRILTVLVAFLFSVPYLGIQLKASGVLFNVLSDGQVSVVMGMFALSAVVILYVAMGGLKSVAYVDCAQAIMLAVGIILLGIIAIQAVGGWQEFTAGFSQIVLNDLAQGIGLTQDGYSRRVAMPGAIQWVSSGSSAVGGVWTGTMCMTYMFALMGIQASPAFSMWAFSIKTSNAFRWQQVVASSLIIGVILFSFTIFQGVAGNILVSMGIFSQVNDKSLVPQLINLMSENYPWLVGLLAVCALAAMQSTGAAYMSTFSGMITRDIYRQYFRKEASEVEQKNVGRIFVFIVAVVALLVATYSTDALVMLGGLAVAYGFQMYPALMANLYFPQLSKRAVSLGLIGGLVAVTLTDKIAGVLPLPWGAYPLTIHSAGWGIFVNLAITIGLSLMIKDGRETQKQKILKHEMLKDLAGVPKGKRKFIPAGIVLVLIWFLFGFGPFAVIGNTLFSNPNVPSTWGLFGLPSLWIWQLCFLIFGIFVMWFLAFFLEFSRPINLERVDEIKKKYFA